MRLLLLLLVEVWLLTRLLLRIEAHVSKHAYVP
jgi:hypothetical protein